MLANTCQVCHLYYITYCDIITWVIVSYLFELFYIQITIRFRYYFVINEYEIRSCIFGRFYFFYYIFLFHFIKCHAGRSK